jgi:hypothetical protein
MQSNLMSRHDKIELHRPLPYTQMSIGIIAPVVMPEAAQIVIVLNRRATSAVRTPTRGRAFRG